MDLLLDLSAAPGSSLRRRAEHALREAVRTGRLAPGTRLPSTRALATQLGVSRGVVVDAYAQLAAEGYLLTRRGGGTVVAAGPGVGDGRAVGGSAAAVASGGMAGGVSGGRASGGARGERRNAASAGARGERRNAASAGARAPARRHDLRPALPALDGFPRSTWLAALGRVLRHAPDERMGYPDHLGVPELRATLAAYLGRVRGVRTEPEQVVITSGVWQGVWLLFTALAERGATRVAIERPGWRGWRDNATLAGLEAVGLPVDADGLVVEALEALGEDAVAAVGVAPAHQFPTGAVLSAERRGALVAWARRTGGLVIEDDYDAEFRYDRKPIGSLQGLAPQVVAYAGSASKLLAPAIRLGWLVLPPDMVAPTQARLRSVGGAPAPLDQLALADLIERGELDRHLRRQRRRYRARRDGLLAALADALPGVTVEGAAAGLHAVLRLPAGLDEAEVVAAAHARGVALQGLGGDAPGLVVGYGNLGDAGVRAAAAALADAIASVARPKTINRCIEAPELA